MEKQRMLFRIWGKEESIVIPRYRNNIKYISKMSSFEQYLVSMWS
jgi:hypothetical protein